jgi:hypothetical protein
MVAGSTVYLVSGTQADILAGPPVVTVHLSQSNSNTVEGWVSSNAAIFQTQDNNNALQLAAYSWSGSLLGTLHMSQTNQQTTAVAFNPKGGSWFLFDSATGKLSRNRPWW